MKSFFVILVLINCFVLDMVFPFFRFRQSDLLNNWRQNVSIALFNILVVTFSTTLLFRAVFESPLDSFLANTPIWASYIAGFVILDVYIYFWHRLMHSTSWGWYLHRFHHEDTTLNTTSAFRFHTLEVLISNIPRVALVWLFSIPLEVFIIYEIVFTSLNIIQHTNFVFPVPVENLLNKIIITPSLHRVHHSNLVAETNSNYSTIFVFWDQIFKTKRVRSRDKEREIAYGV